MIPVSLTLTYMYVHSVIDISLYNSSHFRTYKALMVIASICNDEWVATQILQSECILWYGMKKKNQDSKIGIKIIIFVLLPSFGNSLLFSVIQGVEK